MTARRNITPLVNGLIATFVANCEVIFEENDFVGKSVAMGFSLFLVFFSYLGASEVYTKARGTLK